KGGFVRGAPERHAAWRPRARRTKYQVGSSYTEPYGSVFKASVRGMQGVAARNDASYDLNRERASVTGQTTIAASTATTPLPKGRFVTALVAGALFLSAFLLFVLEPMVAKSILPTLGGTPMAWTRAS